LFIFQPQTREKRRTLISRLAIFRLEKHIFFALPFLSNEKLREGLCFCDEVIAFVKQFHLEIEELIEFGNVLWCPAVADVPAKDRSGSTAAEN